MDEGYPDKAASPTSVLANGSFMASTEAFDTTKKGPPLNGFDHREGREEEEDYDNSVPEKLRVKQGLPFKGFVEEEEVYEGNATEKGDLNDDKGESNEQCPEKQEEDYSYLADLEARAAVKFNK